jgi:hypothetical protein
VITRIIVAGAIVIATTFGGPSAHASDAVAAVPVAPARQAPALDAAEVVLAFGDSLGELHEALAYEQDERDAARVERACGNIVAAHPRLVAAVGDQGTPLLVAAFSMVDACRQGFAMTLDDDGFEVIDGDYFTYRELSFAFTN